MLGIVVVVFVMLKFGIPLLVNISLFLSGSKDNQEQLASQNPSFVAPPIVNPLPQATSSAKIIISGIASKDQTISLYINDSLIDKAKTKNDGAFSFNESIKEGENTIKTKAIENNRESEFSNPVVITLKNAAPTLNVSSPTDGQSFSKDQNIAEIKGATDQDVKVTVNGFWAIADSIGNFSYKFTLQAGENKIKIEAVDLAGNKTEKEIKVNYSP